MDNAGYQTNASYRQSGIGVPVMLTGFHRQSSHNKSYIEPIASSPNGSVIEHSIDNHYSYQTNEPEQQEQTITTPTNNNIPSERVSTFGMSNRHMTLTRPVKDNVEKVGKIRSILLTIVGGLDFIVLIIIAVIGGVMQWTSEFDFTLDIMPSAYCNIYPSTVYTEPVFSDTAVYLTTFLAPLFVIFVGEIILHFLTISPRKYSKTPVWDIEIPQILRRILRYFGMFLFGMFVLMLSVNVIKIRMKVPRPTVQNLCQISCQGQFIDWSKCKPVKNYSLRFVASSFPSSHAATSLFAGLFTTFYLIGAANVYRLRSISVSLISLSGVVLGFIFGIDRYSAGLNWWGDIVVGQLLGAALAVYLSFAVLHLFRYHTQVSLRNIKQQLEYLAAIEKNRESLETLQLERMQQKQQQSGNEYDNYSATGGDISRGGTSTVNLYQP